MVIEMMMEKQKGITYFSILFFIFCFTTVNGQIVHPRDTTRSHLIDVARKIMESSRYCALITVDEIGQARARTMDPLLPDENMVIWFGTNPRRRKVTQIRNNSKVTLYYFDQEELGYVLLMGNAQLISDPDLKQLKMKEEWKPFYSNMDDDFMLIKFIPETMELLSPNHDVLNDPNSWEPPIVKF